MDKAVAVLDEVFTGLKSAVIEDYSHSWIKQHDEKHRRFEDVVIQTLSDSIILHCPSDGQTIQMLDWLTVLQTTRVIQRRLFDNGFPSRGGIASGDYFFRDGFLVGSPFMDAYRMSQSLEFVGAAMSANCFSRFKSDSRRAKAKWEKFPGGVEYHAPLKGDREQRLYCLCPLRRNEIEDGLGRDLPSVVRASFWQHGKDVPAAVDGKVNNTIKFWSYWICRKGDHGA